MATSKSSDAASKTTTLSSERDYENTVAEFATATDLAFKGDFERARPIYQKIADSGLDEPALIERARAYLRVCERKLAPPVAEPTTPDDLYYRAVVLINRGEHAEARGLLDRALQERGDSAKARYARASSWALEGNADAAVADLRSAIEIDPAVRFQAANDADFEAVREEPAFIDIIEPTPTEV